MNDKNNNKELTLRELIRGWLDISFPGHYVSAEKVDDLETRISDFYSFQEDGESSREEKAPLKIPED